MKSIGQLSQWISSLERNVGFLDPETVHADLASFVVCLEHAHINGMIDDRIRDKVGFRIQQVRETIEHRKGYCLITDPTDI